MSNDDNIIFSLINKLSNVPKIFFNLPQISNNREKRDKTISIKSIFNDLIFNLTNNFLSEESLKFLDLKYSPQNSNYLNIIGLICYLLNDNFFKNKKLKSTQIINLLINRKIQKLSELINFDKFVNDSDRREEIVRTILSELEILPSNETKNYFFDRLSTLDSVERYFVIEKGKEARERAKKIREEIERKRREEEDSASKMSRE